MNISELSILRKYSLLWLIFAGFLALVAYEAPFIFNGVNSPVKLHDEFDHIFAVHAARYLPGNQPVDNRMPFLLGGLPLAAFSPECDALSLLFRWLPPYWALRANDWILRTVAFIGMFLLLLRLPHRNAWIAFLSAIGFSWLPFWNPGGLTIAGIPLVLLAAWLLLQSSSSKSDRIVGLFILAIFPFYSMLTHTGVHLLFFLGLLWAAVCIRTRKINLLFLAALFLMATGYIYSNLALFLNQFGANHFVWHRVEWPEAPHRTLSQILAGLGHLLLYSQEHAKANPLPFIWPTFLVFLGVIFYKKMVRMTGAWRNRPFQAEKKPNENSATSVCPQYLALGCFGLILLIAVATGLWYETEYFNIRGHIRRFSPFLASYNMRFYFFYPVLFYGMFYGSLLYLSIAVRTKKIPIGLYIATVLAFGAIASNWFVGDWRALRNGPNYEQYESRSLFDTAEQKIGLSRCDFKIACLGFYPAMAHLNGYQTVDGYWYLYPLEYKHRFRAVIERELQKSEELKTYFDKWGSRCYVFSAELGLDFLYPKTGAIRSISDLQISTPALQKLGASYLFSAVEIANAKEIGLSLLGKVDDPSSWIMLYIYAI